LRTQDPEAAIEGTIGIDRQVSPPAIGHPEIVPCALAIQRVAAQEERPQRVRDEAPRTLGRAPGETEHRGAFAVLGLERHDEEFEALEIAGPERARRKPLRSTAATPDVDLGDAHRSSFPNG
jgi:hypothetical protein